MYSWTIILKIVMLRNVRLNYDTSWYHIMYDRNKMGLLMSWADCVWTWMTFTKNKKRKLLFKKPKIYFCITLLFPRGKKLYEEFDWWYVVWRIIYRLPYPIIIKGLKSFPASIWLHVLIHDKILVLSKVKCSTMNHFHKHTHKESSTLFE